MNQPVSSTPGLLISVDLFFGSKITGTAQQLGLKVETVANIGDALTRIQETSFGCVLVDLALPGLSIEELTSGLPASERPPIVAFGSHVHTSLLDAARQAGCDEVLPRSRFSSTLPELLMRYLQP